MKKLFLFTLIIAGASASFGQAQTTSQPIKRNNTAPTYSEAQQAKLKKESTKDMPASNNAKATKATTATKAQTK